MRMLIALAVMMLAVSPAHAGGFIDWLDEGSSRHDVDRADGDGAVLLTLEAGENEMYPKVSPDGKYLLVIAGKHGKPVISLRMLENGDPVHVVGDYDQQIPDSIAWHGNDEITFLSYRSDSLGLWRKPVTGGVLRTLDRRLDGELRTPLILDDESVIAVRLDTAADHGGGDRQHGEPLFTNWQVPGKHPSIARISGQGAEVELAAGVNPALSPDGTRIAFSMQEKHNWHLFMMNVDGSDLVQLTEGDHVDAQPAWSPDGRWLAFTSNRSVDGEEEEHHNNNWNIWLIGRDGRNLMRLTSDKARDGAPSIANNGKVYFHSDRHIERDDEQEHQVRGATSGFHIWSIELPAKVS
ncbi:hypothetical protein FEF65_11785 [Mariprofundus erugo]|uniref:TolB protein n=2 Tax=Mariprofundus erugo TaxID=2528639 RepID=A0A5R9GP03_9PROT|nr:hypothetical protein FEF65_11785 [Mariprofundus erugo]